MSFYFSLPEKKSKSRMIYDCSKCKRDEDNKNKVGIHIGKNYDGLVILKEYPIGPNYHDGLASLEEVFRRNRRKLYNECAIVYSIPCLKNKIPTVTQYKCCYNNVIETLRGLNPKMIIVLGELSFQQVMNLKAKEGITKIRNNFVPLFELNCVLFTTFNPTPYFPDSAAYHSSINTKGLNNLPYQNNDAYKKDLERALEAWDTFYSKRRSLDRFLKSRKILDNIKITELHTFQEVKYLFEKILPDLTEVALDYETTNAYPHDNYFEIVMIQFGIKDKAWVLSEKLWLRKPKLKQYLYRKMRWFITNNNIKKVIHNAKFEEMCSAFIFNTPIIDSKFCTMIASHAINEKRGTKSLDFLNMIRFGIPPYSDTVKSFIVPKEKTDKVNNIRKAPHDDLVLYGGLDVITTFNQYLLLNNHHLENKNYPKARANYELLLEGSSLFSEMSMRGIYVGPDELASVRNTLELQMKKLIDKMMRIPEFRAYNNYLKEKNGSIEDIDSNLAALSKRATRRKLNLNIDKGSK